MNVSLEMTRSAMLAKIIITNIHVCLLSVAMETLDSMLNWKLPQTSDDMWAYTNKCHTPGDIQAISLAPLCIVL